MKKEEDFVRAIDLISLSEASKISGLTRDHLGRLAKSKTIWAIKVSRDWLTTKNAVLKYLAEEHKPGVKPKNR